MAELGRVGGLASVRSRLGLDGIADDDLREKARQRLNAMLDSDSEQVRLAASKALFSYSTTPAPGGAGSGVPYPAAPSVEHDWQAVRDALYAAGVLRPGPLLTGKADPMTGLYAENAELKRRIRELETELEKRSADK